MIIITAEVHPVLIEGLEKQGLAVDYAPAITYAELRTRIAEATGLVVTTRIKVDKELLAMADKLEWIGRLGSGLELIDIPYAESKGIRCFSTPEGNRNSVAEQAVGMLISLMHNITRSYMEVREGKWLRNQNRGTELKGKTVGIIGYGNTGSAFVSLLQSFGVTILAYDKYRTGFGDKTVREASLEQVCRYADIISFHVPLTEETRHMANAAFFSACGQQPYILNTSRGEVVDTRALLEALDAGKLRGAGLDVLENERIDALSPEEEAEFKALLAHSNVIITPHIGGYSHEAYRLMSVLLLEKLGLQP